MFKYTSRQVKQLLKQNNLNSVNQLRKQKNDKYNQTMKFMSEWANDLLIRQHQYSKNQQKLLQELIQFQNVSKNKKSKSKQSSSKVSSIDIQAIIQQQLIQKIQNVYAKQITLYEASMLSDNTFSISNSQQCSQNQQLKSYDEYQTNSRQKSQSNFQQYFNGYQCQTQTKKFSKASELRQQQSNSIQQQSFNQIHEVNQQSSVQENSQTTYSQKDFISF